MWWFVFELTGSHKCNADGSEEKYEAVVVLKKLAALLENSTFKDFFIKCVDSFRNDDSQCSPTEQPCSHHSDQLQLLLDTNNQHSLFTHCIQTERGLDRLHEGHTTYL